MMPQPETEPNAPNNALSAGLLELAAAALKQANSRSSVPANHTSVAPKVEPTGHALDHCLPAMWKNTASLHATGGELPSSEPATGVHQQPPLPHPLPVRRKPRKPRTSASTNNSTVAPTAAAVAAQDLTAPQLQLQLLQQHQQHLQEGASLQEAAYNDAADMEMADANVTCQDDDELYRPPGAAKRPAGPGSRSRKGSSRGASGAAAVARRSVKASSNSGDVSDVTDSGLLYCNAGDGDLVAAASKSKQDRLKEKNRLAQRRFRARQKTMLEQMQVRMDELAKQVEHSSKELNILHKENLLLRSIVQEQQKALLAAVVQQQVLPDSSGEQQQGHQDGTAGAAAVTAEQQLQRLQELYAAHIKIDEDQQAAVATAAVAAATAALHSAGEAMAAVTGGRL